MSLTRELRLLALLAAVIAVAAAAFFIGGSLKPSEEPFYVFETEAAAYGNISTIPATSQGGFTGFGETDGSAAHTVIAGHVVELGEGFLVIEAPNGQQARLQFEQDPDVVRIAQGSTEMLQPGATIAVLPADDAGIAASVLIISQP